MNPSLAEQNKTRWTFSRVKLVFECEFEISWSLGTRGPWDTWTLEPLNLGTLGPIPSSNTSSYFPFALIFSYLPLSLPPTLLCYGLVMVGGKGVLEMEH